MTAPQVLYCLVWTMPGEEITHRALVNHAASMALASVLEPAGATVTRTVEMPAQGRHAAPEPPVDEPLTGEAARRTGARLRTLYGSSAAAVADVMFSDRSPRSTCRGCSGTCCTGEGSEACTCAEECQ